MRTEPKKDGSGTWAILAPLTAWSLLTPYANQQDIVLAIPALLLLTTNMRLSLLNRGLLVIIAIVVSSTQEILIPRLSMAYDVDAIMLAALLMEIFVVWWPSPKPGSLAGLNVTRIRPRPRARGTGADR